MTYKECIMTDSECYQQGTRAKKFKGIVVHDTGAGNPYIKRYVQPSDDDPNKDEILADIGVNENGNDWNHTKRKAGVHDFIGKNAAGEVETYHVIPYDRFAWGVGQGTNGSYNFDPTARIQFEICDDGYRDEAYFNAAMREAQELCAYYCRTFLFNPLRDICSHHESYKAGYGNNHGDCDLWLAAWGKDMDWFRKCVLDILAEEYEYVVYNINDDLLAYCKTKAAADQFRGCRAVPLRAAAPVEPESEQDTKQEEPAEKEAVEQKSVVSAKVQKGTVLRTVALIAAIINQVIAVLGSSSFASSPWYQIASLVATAATAAISAWENNDWTFYARVGTGVLDALEDKKITIEEAEELLRKATK